MSWHRLLLLQVLSSTKHLTVAITLEDAISEGNAVEGDGSERLAVKGVKREGRYQSSFPGNECATVREEQGITFHDFQGTTYPAPDGPITARTSLQKDVCVSVNCKSIVRARCS